jgi:PPOX class probable F420-dependent enzyme
MVAAGLVELTRSRLRISFARPPRGCRAERERRLCSLARVSSLPNRFYHWIRHPSAGSLAREQRTVSGFEHLRGHKYCLLVTYKRSGEAVPTPVWFGLAEGKLYARSEANVAKIKRLRNDPTVRVAACTVRGKPLGPPAEGRARVLDHPSHQEGEAEAALRTNYGLARKIYEAVGGALGAETVYLEITPA